MSNLALKDVEAEFGRNADLPKLVVKPGSSVEDTLKTMAEFADKIEQFVASRKVETIQFRLEQASFYRDMFSDPTKHSAAMILLDATIEFLDSAVAVGRAGVESTPDADQEIANLATMSTKNAKFARRLFKKAKNAQIDLHNSTVDTYYFYLALRAEYDPESRGGVTLASPDDVDAYFKEIMGV